MSLLALAQRRTDPRLTALLSPRLDALATGNPGGVYSAAERQLSPEITRALFAKYPAVPEPLKGRMTLLLEHTFNARLGNDPAAWTGWLAAQKP